LKRLGLENEELPAQNDRAGWPTLRARFAQVFRSRTRDDWSRLLEGTDTCFAPVLSIDEAPEHAHAAARANYVTIDGIRQPGPAPRFSRTKPEIRSGPPTPGEHTEAALGDWGVPGAEIAKLRAAGAIR